MTFLNDALATAGIGNFVLISKLKMWQFFKPNEENRIPTKPQNKLQTCCQTRVKLNIIRVA